MSDETTSQTDSQVPEKPITESGAEILNSAKAWTRKRQTPRSTVHLDPTDEQKIQWMEQWKANVTSEIDGYSSARADIYAIYKKQKDMYDSWLSGKLKKMKKYDMLINRRKKVLLDINKELDRLRAPQSGSLLGQLTDVNKEQPSIQ